MAPAIRLFFCFVAANVEGSVKVCALCLPIAVHHGRLVLFVDLVLVVPENRSSTVSPGCPTAGPRLRRAPFPELPFPRRSRTG